MSLPALLTALTLAAAAGTRGMVPLLLLGLFHHTRYFELPPRLELLSRPEVLALLAVLLVVESWMDAHPDLGRFSDLLAWTWKAAAGFLAFAAAVGSVDAQLGSSLQIGAFGAVVAGAAHWARTWLRAPLREHAEQVHESLGTGVTLAETGAGAVLGASSIVAPVLGASLLLVGGALALGTRKGLGALGTRPCSSPACGRRIDRRATVCPSCRTEQAPG